MSEISEMSEIGGMSKISKIMESGTLLATTPYMQIK
jgi:hypothetical protein